MRSAEKTFFCNAETLCRFSFYHSFNFIVSLAIVENKLTKRATLTFDQF